MPQLGSFGLLELIGHAAGQQKTAYISPAPGEDTSAHGGNMVSQAFQYWPAQISDTQDPGWREKEIPGGSHPLLYWAQGGLRAISFTALFTRDVDANFTVADLISGNVPEAVIYDKKRNPDLRAVRRWLEWYKRPKYEEDGFAIPPPKLMLVFPGLQLGSDGADELLCILRDCNFTYLDFFPSGVPRKMEVELTFNECVQNNGQVTWIGRDIEMIGEAYGPLDYVMEIVK